MILDRPRHAELIDEVRASGARIRLISDGDIFGAIASAWPEAGVDVLIGVGGTPEGVIAAAALKSMGGEIQARLCPQSDEERAAVVGRRLRPRPRAHHDDLVQGDNCFFAATGITDGELLRGVRFDARGAHTQSLVMRSRSGTVRLIDASHRVASCRSSAPSTTRDRVVSCVAPSPRLAGAAERGAEFVISAEHLVLRAGHRDRLVGDHVGEPGRRDDVGGWSRRSPGTCRCSARCC